jgi:hypothetical protein
MAADIRVGTIRTQSPARLDRLPWSRFSETGNGMDLTTADSGHAAASYVAGACGGAPVVGRLTKA